MPFDHPGRLAVALALSAGLSALSIYLLKPLLARYLLAHPNERSSHSTATPQGAGAGVMIAVIAVCVLATLLSPTGWPNLVPVIVGAILLTVVGLADDVRALGVWWRFAAQIGAALLIALTLPAEFRILPDLLPLWLERGLIVLGTVWFVNAVNFLDGLDWMTLAQAVPMTFGVAALAALGVVPAGIGLLALVLLAALLGFAPFNKHKAQVFLGDAGSLPIGLILAYLLIYVAEAHVVSALLLALYTLADATITLLRRIARREAILSAHRTHFYQRAVAEGLRVPQVTARVFAICTLLALLAVVAANARSLPVDVLCLCLGTAATGLTLFALARGR
jgi:UDP-N-acetylmuramyl pentapeptide phosphotransferase/UDP-N-acetylglucosamine-1-phosphate transferase